jgi:hypothetical protein
MIMNKMSNLIAMGGVAVVVGVVLMSGCSNDAQPGDDEDTTSTVGMALSGADFAGNSVQITGTRSTVADPKYPCASTATDCFDFDAAGHPLDPMSGANGFSDLCPTEDLSAAGATGTWTFTYTIYSAPGCAAGGGTVLNAPLNPDNFVCYDIADIAAELNPNETVGETLLPGANANTIVCISEGANKTFDFNACNELTPAPDLLLDCGCALLASGGCTCPQFDATPALPATCSFTATCEITCT